MNVGLNLFHVHFLSNTSLFGPNVLSDEPSYSSLPSISWTISKPLSSFTSSLDCEALIKTPSVQSPRKLKWWPQRLKSTNLKTRSIISQDSCGRQYMFTIRANRQTIPEACFQTGFAPKTCRAENLYRNSAAFLGVRKSWPFSSWVADSHCRSNFYWHPKRRNVTTVRKEASWFKKPCMEGKALTHFWQQFHTNHILWVKFSTWRWSCLEAATSLPLFHSRWVVLPLPFSRTHFQNLIIARALDLSSFGTHHQAALPCCCFMIMSWKEEKTNACRWCVRRWMAV